MLKMLRPRKVNGRGQSFVEYSALLIIMTLALLTIQTYVKRGFQGRWKSTMDDFGEQYDPWVVNSSMAHSILTNAYTEIQTVPALDPFNPGNPVQGFETNRVDFTNSVEFKRGISVVGQ